MIREKQIIALALVTPQNRSSVASDSRLFKILCKLTFLRAEMLKYSTIYAFRSLQSSSMEKKKFVFVVSDECNDLGVSKRRHFKCPIYEYLVRLTEQLQLPIRSKHEKFQTLAIFFLRFIIIVRHNNLPLV